MQYSNITASLGKQTDLNTHILRIGVLQNLALRNLCVFKKLAKRYRS